MATGQDGGEPTSMAPEAAFSLLGNGTRIEILWTLWDIYEPYSPENALSFSELHDRVEIEDPGNFNYHLEKLTDHFVRAVDDGYELAPPGVRVINAVIAGTPTADPSLEPMSLDVTCFWCDAPVELSYADGTTWIRCTDCVGYWVYREGELLGFALPPGGFSNRTPDELLNATLAYSLHQIGMFDDGVCPTCGGVVDASMEVCQDHDAGDGVCEACGVHFLGLLWLSCSSCKHAFVTPSWAPVQRHPAVVSFYYERGVTHRPTSWDAVRRGFEWDEVLLSVNPPEVRVDVSHGTDQLSVTLDETGSVVDVDG